MSREAGSGDRGRKTAAAPDPSGFSHPDTVAVLAGRRSGGAELAPALYPTTTFRIPSLEAGSRMALDSAESRYYTRNGNPTVAAFEQAMAELEGAEASGPSHREWAR